MWGCRTRRLVLPGVRVPLAYLYRAITGLCDSQPQPFLRNSMGLSYGEGVHGITEWENVTRRSERLKGK